jgi:hypothetical protein
MTCRRRCSAQESERRLVLVGSILFAIFEVPLRLARNARPLHVTLNYLRVYLAVALRANIRTPAEDEKSSENYDYYGFLLKSIELQLGTLIFIIFASYRSQND